MVMTYSRAKSSTSVVSRLQQRLVTTNGRTDRQTNAIALPPELMQSVT